ncbi:leucine-rich repeat domain-containing protein [Treponema sp.]|uniref:leucine-rich repeat domain-containing protein n=1 Tax=Treponema sp. TaxID=166 RepID=UPI00388DD738
MKKLIFILFSALFLLASCANPGGGSGGSGTATNPGGGNENPNENPEQPQPVEVFENGYLVVNVNKDNVLSVIQNTTKDTKLVLANDCYDILSDIRYGVADKDYNFILDLSNVTSMTEVPSFFLYKAGHSFTNITNVKLPNTVTVIKNYAFAKTSISNIELSSNVTLVEFKAFWVCEKLKTIKINSANITINDPAFEGCSNVEEVYTTTGNFIEKMNAGSSLKKIVFTSVPKVFTGFANTTKITKVVIPEGVEEIGENAFYNSSVKDITFPSTLKKINKNAFKDWGSTIDYTYSFNVDAFDTNFWYNSEMYNKYNQNFSFSAGSFNGYDYTSQPPSIIPELGEKIRTSEWVRVNSLTAVPE